tara:strand:+ start:1896 stop:3572 length:1677 start_codon:yes stop_codon:yes gene_type:complete
MKKTTKLLYILYVVIGVSLFSTYVFLDNVYREKYPEYFDDPQKMVFPQIEQNTIQFTIVKQYEIEFDKVSNVFRQIEDYPDILPKNIESVIIIEEDENYILAKEKFSERGIGAEFLVEHRWDGNQHLMEILDGDAKNSKIIQTFEEIGNSTKITTDVDIKFKGLLSVLRFIPQQNLMHATETALDAFSHYAKGFDDQNEKLVDDVYREILQRPADNEGLVYYSEQLKNKKMTPEEIKEILRNSDEYKLLQNEFQNKNFIKHELVTSIKVGDPNDLDLPIGISSNPITKKIYVSNNNTNTVSVIDSVNNKVLNSVNVEKGPSGVAVNSNTNRIYVANYYSDNISVIDGNDDILMDVIDVGDSPRNIAVNPVTNKIYVANHFGNSIYVIDGDTNSVIDSIGIERPWGISINTDTNVVYITSTKSTDIFLIDGYTNNLSKLQIDYLSGIPPLEIESISKNILLLSFRNNVVILDELTMQKIIIPVGNNIVEIEVNENLNVAYALDSFLNSMFVIDLDNNRVSETISTERHPIGITVDPETNLVYVVNEYADSISVFNSSFE